MTYETVIGLEIHVQLNTETKIFCNCATTFGSDSNTQTCPVCLGMPGVLPVLNEKVVEKGVRAGLSFHSNVSKFSKFDRKNYFYPDLPKAYQISQFNLPICEGGHIDIVVDGEHKRIGVTRLHLEEDAGKLIHSEDPDRAVSMIDLNRSGVPLAEIVSEPDMRSADEAYEYLQKMRTLMKYIGVSDVNMEEGSMRCDVNISLRPFGREKFGEKVEIKNLNSFKAVKAAIHYEFGRQERMLNSNELIVQETRLWNPDKGETFSMRSKEDAHDYRYFPDPDLAPITLDDEYINKIRESLPELPDPKFERFKKEYDLPDYDATVLTAVRQVADYYEAVVSNKTNPKKASNWIMAELMAKLEDSEKIDEFIVTPKMLAELLTLIDNKTISGKIAKTVFEAMIKEGKNAGVIVEEKGLKQVTDTGAIEKIVDDVLANNAKSIEDYRSGKENAIKFLVGQVMKESRGKANPQVVNEILLKKLA